MLLIRMVKRWRNMIWAVLLLLVSQGTLAQRMVLAMPDDNGVWVRWTSPDLKSKNGIRVYRQEGGAGEWKLLNETPFTYGQADITALAASNKDIQNAKQMADGMRAQNKLEGIGLALVLTNAIESREFSQYLGIIYYDKTAEPGKDYRYEVKEVAGTNETSYGQSPVVRAGKFKPGMAPQEFKSKVGDGELYFSWKPEQERLTGAHIYYKLGGGSWQRLNKRIILPSKVPQKNGEKAFPEWLFMADSLQNGTTYTCILKGVDLFGFETEPTPEFKLTPLDKTPPPAPSKFDLAVNMDKVTATWELPTTKGVEGLNLYRTKGLDTNWVKLNKQPLPPTLRKYEDQVDEQGVTYTYAVASFDKAGNENRTDGRFITVRDLKPPVQVRNLKAVADTGVVKLTWFPNPEKDLAGYIVYRVTKTGTQNDTLQLLTAPLKAPAYNDTLPKVAKNEFVYFVSAQDTNFNLSRKSNAAAAILPDPEPPITPAIKAIRKDGETLRVVWLPNLDIDLAGYIVYRSLSETPVDSAWKPQTTRPLSSTDTAYSDRNIEAGVRYYYAIAAVDRAGNESPRSEAFAGNVTAIRLRTIPQNLEVKSGKGKTEAKISWTIAADPDVIGCMLYRKEAKDAFIPVSGLIQQNEYTDKGLQRGTTYYYEVRAFDKAGNVAKSAPAQLMIEAD